MRNNIKGNSMLVLCAVIWGVAFVAQSVGMDYVGPFTFQAVRTFLGFIVLVPVCLVFDMIKKKEGKYEKHDKRILIKGGIICGAVLCIATNFQQIGMAVDASAGDAGFITALYILIVPVIRMIFHKKIGYKVWIGVAMALFGLYLLTEKFNGFTLGSFMVLMSAFAFAVHILVVDYFAPKTDGVKLSCLQFLVSSVIATLLMLAFEKPSIQNIWNAKESILYAGIMSSGIAYTLQILGQKYTKPTPASMIMSLESVFALLSGMILQPLENPFKWIKISGCVIIFASIIIAQLPDRKKELL